MLIKRIYQIFMYFSRNFSDKTIVLFVRTDV